MSVSGKLLGTLRIRLTTDTEEFRKKTGEARKDVLSLKSAFDKLKESSLAEMLTFAGIAEGLHKVIDASAEYAEEIDTMSLKTGIGTDALQELKYVASQTHIEFENLEQPLASFLTKLPQIQSGTGYAAQAWQQLGISLNDSHGHMKSLSELFPEMVSRLGTMRNETQRLAIATQLFGGQAVKLAPLFAAGGDEIAKLTQKAKELGLITSQEGIESLVAYSEEMSTLKQEAAAAGRNLTLALMPALRGIIDIMPDIAKATDFVIKDFETMASVTEAIFGGTIDVIRAGMHGGFREAKQDIGNWIEGVREEVKDIWKGVAVPAPNVAPSGPSGPDANAQKLEDIRTQASVNRIKVLAGVEEQRLEAHHKMDDLLRLQLNTADEIYGIQKRALQSDVTLSDSVRTADLLKLKLAHQLEDEQLKLNSALAKELELHEKRNALLSTAANMGAGIVGQLIGGEKPSGGEIGSDVGTLLGQKFFSSIPVIGGVLSTLGGAIGSLFGKKKPEVDPVIKSLSAIERAQRDTITTIQASTDALLNPGNRFLNLPATFTVPDYMPGFGGGSSRSVTVGATNVTVNLTVNGSNMTPDDVKSVLLDNLDEAVGNVLYQQRLSQAWS